MKARKKMISERSISIDRRTRFGHWEGDLLLFKQTKTNLFTLRERKSRFIIAIKNRSRQAKTTTRTFIKYMKKHVVETMKTLTLDNGVEFADHEEMGAQLKTKIYFCEPYKSYQKGAIENANKLLRTQLPKTTKLRL